MKDNYLPIDKPEITCSMEQDLLRHSDDSYVKEKLLHLKRKNPVVHAFLTAFSQASNDPIMTMFCGLIIYKMLESQAEADFMNSETDITV